MKSFWNSKAREKASYYVSSYHDYDQQDMDEFWKWGRKLAEEFLAESGIEFDGSERVLEIGCGIGRMTRYFAERFREVHGLDVSEEMVARARQHLAGTANVTLHVGTGTDLSDFSDGEFDLVFSYIVFQHIPDARITQQYIRDTGRVLRTGGHFLFQVNNVPLDLRSRLRIRSRLKTVAAKLTGANPVTEDSGPSGLDHPAWRGSRISRRDVERCCRDGGMTVLSVRGEGTQYMWVTARKN